MNSTPSTEPQQPSIWQYVPISDYKVPPATIGHTIRGGLAGLWQALRPSEKQEASSSLQVEDELQTLALEVLDCVASRPDYRMAVLALKDTLSSWIDTTPEDRPAVVVVGPTHSGNAEIVGRLGKELNWKQIAAPTTEQILAGAADWPGIFRDGTQLWVLPELGKCCLRHFRGLALVRQFFEQLQSGSLGHGIIGCNSWTWAYLKHVIPGILPEAFAAQAFDHERLARWFHELAMDSCEQKTLFRQSNDGSYVLPPPQRKETDKDEASVAVNPFLKHLAAYSRGIPGVAWSIWRTALRTLPDQSVLDKHSIEFRNTQEPALWVLPWEKIAHPSLPSNMPPDYLLTLHNLLLHNGLSASVLALILPLLSQSMSQTLFALKSAGLIEKNGDLWRISAQGYPIVRRFLDAQGYLTDDL